MRVCVLVPCDLFCSPSCDLATSRSRSTLACDRIDAMQLRKVYNCACGRSHVRSQHTLDTSANEQVLH